MALRMLIKEVRRGGIVLALFAFFSGWTAGQSAPAPATLLVPQPAQQTALQQAWEFEQREQWGDALLVYQQALKLNPHDTTLQHKRIVARIQLELARRSADPARWAQWQQLDSRQAANVYAEVLQKIHTYHVESPDWHALSRYGLISLQAALAHPPFRNHWLRSYRDDQIAAAWETLLAVLKNVAVNNRNDSLAVADRTVRVMSEQLALPASIVYLELLSGATAGLDMYSSFLTREQFQDTMSQIDGNFVGLGVELKLQPHELSIVNVIAQGPAGRSGIRAGDAIIAVEGQTVQQVGAERCADLLRGREGSYVGIQVRRANGSVENLYLQRRRVDIPSLEEARLIDASAGIAYVRLVNFQKTTGQDLDAELWQLHRQGMRSLIIDVRGNPGGLLTAAVDSANRFLDGGVIVSTRGRNPLEDFTHHAQAEGTWRMPLVVLIDENSASASEIFAAAIADHRRGTIIGQQSYGKGSVQGIFPLSGEQGGLRLTTALFYSPRGTPISQSGVAPDVVVAQVAKPAASEPPSRTAPPHDPCIEAALSVLNPIATQPAFHAKVAGQ